MAGSEEEAEGHLATVWVRQAVAGVDLVVVVVVVDQVGPGDGKCSARSAFMMPMSGEACNAVS